MESTPSKKSLAKRMVEIGYPDEVIISSLATTMVQVTEEHGRAAAEKEAESILKEAKGEAMTS